MLANYGSGIPEPAGTLPMDAKAIKNLKAALDHYEKP